jgi:hypothetical protein
MKTKSISTNHNAGRLFCCVICVGVLNLLSLQAQNLFVSQDGYILEFTPGGTYSTFDTGPGNFMIGLAFDGRGDLFAASEDTGSIFEFPPGGERTTFASGLNGPFSLAFNSAGTLFMGGAGGLISEFTPSGTQRTFASGLDAPYATALAFDGAGDLFVGASNNGLPDSG